MVLRMDKEYIDKHEAYMLLKHEVETHELPASKEAYERAMRIIDMMKPCDRRLATWIVHGIYARCSECEETGGMILNGDKQEPFLTKFCPNCGARMRGTAVRWEVKA